MQYTNICKKYDLTEEEFDKALKKVYHSVRMGELFCDVNILLAITDFFCYADIPPVEE